jgi:hypothetical protein
VWVDAGNDPGYAKLKANRIDTAYFDVRDPRVTRTYLNDVRAKGYGVGIYAAWNWPEVPQTGTTFAQWLSTQLGRFGSSSAPTFPRVCADIETHDVSYVLAFLKRWRQLRPRRVTDWTLEGFQGGLFTPSDAALILEANVGVSPQLYNGDMTQAWDSLAAARNLMTAGFPEGVVVPFYDAAHLPEWWEGYAFTQGRLP